MWCGVGREELQFYDGQFNSGMGWATVHKYQNLAFLEDHHVIHFVEPIFVNSSDVIQARWLALYVTGNVSNIMSRKQRGLANLPMTSSWSFSPAALHAVITVMRYLTNLPPCRVTHLNEWSRWYSPIQHASFIHFEDDFIFILIADSRDGFSNCQL